MIKNQGVALMISALISIAVGLIALTFLGTESWLSIIIEMAAAGVAFIIAYNVLPYTSSELANADSLIRRATLVREAKEDLANIQRVNSVYPDRGARSTVEQIVSVATRILSDVTRPGQNNDSKLVMLHEYLDDLDKYFLYIYRIESGDLSVDSASKEVQVFRNELPETLEAFINLKTSVNATEAAKGKAHGAALRMKMASSGMKRTTLKDIDSLLGGD